jgi:hypothetical protein
MKDLKQRNGIKLVLNLLTKLYEVLKGGKVMFKSNDKNKAMNQFYNVARANSNSFVCL